MADIKLYHGKHTRSLRVIWALEELGLPYAIEEVELAHGNTGGEKFKSVNSWQKLPAISVDGEVMVESTAILEYLATKLADGKLAISPDQPGYSQYLQWLHGGESGFGMYLSLFLGHSILLPEENRDAKLAEWSLDHLKRGFALFGEQLGENEYVAGDEFSMADISVGYVCYITAFAKPLMGIAPANVLKWWGRCQARPAWNRAMRINLGKLQPGDK